MAKKSIYENNLSGGINRGTLSSERDGAYLIKNMINSGGKSKKRNGHQNIACFTDDELNRLRINGIYNYSYVDENGEYIASRIVHAGTRLFKATSDFEIIGEIPLAQGVSLKNERSRGFTMGKNLWIIGAGNVLIYDGGEVRYAYAGENAYVPDTTAYLKDGKICKNESPNLLTSKRVNRFLSSSIYRDSGTTNIFILDEKIKYGTKFVLEIKIRTRTSEEEENSTTSSYIGVDSRGVEVNRIVTIKYARKSIDGGAYFLSEPIRDEAGNVINIKIGDEIYTYDKLPWSMSITNGRELRIAYDITPPSKSEENIKIEYEAEGNGEEAIFERAKIGALANGDKGGQILLLGFDNNTIRFTDENKGFFYFPRKNEISLGSDGEKINAIIRLSDNLVGVFKEKSFYRIRFTSANDSGYEIYSSSDSLGAYSIFSSAMVDYDCLVFNEMGVCGVSEYKTVSNAFNCLRQRSDRINPLLEKYTENERREAQSISFGARYYLFIGEDVYIADTRRKIKESGAQADDFQYEWWLWDNCCARVLYSDGINLYFGTEDGEIRKFTKDFCDIQRYEYKKEDLSLLQKNQDTYSELLIPERDSLDYEKLSAYLSSHRRLISKDAIYERGELYFSQDDFFYKNGALKIYEGEYAEIYKRSGEYITGFYIEKIDPVFKSVAVETSALFTEGEGYYVYFYYPNGKEYGALKALEGVSLTLGGEPIKIREEENLTLVLFEKTPITCVYKTNSCSLDRPRKKKSIYKLFLKPTKETEGKIEITLKTEKSKIKKALTISEPLDFEKTSFESLSFGAEKGITYPISAFLRGFENITFEIKSQTDKDFGIEGLSALYEQNEKGEI